MKIVFLQPAQIELDDAVDWHEEQVVGLGNEFLDEIDQSLRLISSFPLLQPLVDKKVRRCLVNRFPYGIFYAVAENIVIVVAVAHLRREPGYWKNRK